MLRMVSRFVIAVRTSNMDMLWLYIYMYVYIYIHMYIHIHTYIICTLLNLNKQLPNSMLLN